MSDEIKSGKELIEDFFKDICLLDNIDKDTADELISLYNQGRFTNAHITNALDRLIDKKLEEFTEEDEQN